MITVSTIWEVMEDLVEHRIQKADEVIELSDGRMLVRRGPQLYLLPTWRALPTGASSAADPDAHEIQEAVRRYHLGWDESPRTN